MEVYRRSSGLLLLLGFALLATILQGVQSEAETEGPSESECRPYIEKALKELEASETTTEGSPEATDNSEEDTSTVSVTADDSEHKTGDNDTNNVSEEDNKSSENLKETKSEPEPRPSLFQKITTRLSQIFQRAPKKEIPTEEPLEYKKLEEKKSEDSQENGEADADSKDNETEEKFESSETDKKEDQVVSQEVDNENVESAEHADSLKEGDEATDDNETEELTKSDENKEEDTRESDEDKEPDDATAHSQEEIENITEEAHEGEEENDTKEKLEEIEQENREKQESIEHQETTSREGQIDIQEVNNQEDETDTKKDTTDSTENDQADAGDDKVDTEEDQADTEKDQVNAEDEQVTINQDDQVESEEDQPGTQKDNDKEQSKEEQDVSTEEQHESVEQAAESLEQQISAEEPGEDSSKQAQEEKDETDGKSEENVEGESDDGTKENGGDDSKEDAGEPSKEDQEQSAKHQDDVDDGGKEIHEGGSIENIEDKDEQERDEQTNDAINEEADNVRLKREVTESIEDSNIEQEGSIEDATSVEEVPPVEELSFDTDVPAEMRSRDHVERLLKLDEESSETEKVVNHVNEITLKELKKLYENAIKPLETLYKYRDLSNRHFGDSEIFSKPLILFMGPWSGGKSSIINYLLNIEYNETALRTGAEPSPAYFNILMYGEEPEILDGTELVADFTFSGLQKFGQGLEERLKGVKVPIKLLEKVNIVEIPGILEVRKQVSRMFPFNDACQWFIDRADLIFLVYDPSKLDVGPETEAILDQLKGREHQTRIILNKADQVKPEELMRVQGALIWNISPLMSSPQPPVMYTTSLWSRPYEEWAPGRLLQAQERALLRDLRNAIDKRIENKIASARRFAVRVRNHAKMVDCYLTTYYNHKSVFGNRKQVADTIIEHPQDYHIYEGLSTLTNISRYDLPDPDVYRDFFKLNPLYEFQQLSATCTYFRGCPINRLDIAIAYDFPELIGTHKKLVENALAKMANHSTSAPGS